MSQSVRRPHQCEHCSKCFASSHQLAQHNRIHTGEKPYKCTFCDKRFKQLSHVQQHTRLHTGERPYKCSVPDCGRAFIQLSNLQQHMRSHCTTDKNDRDAEKKYFCNICGKGFKGQGSLYTHQTKKHANFDKQNVSESCPICHVAFASREDIAVHLKKEHHDSESQRNSKCKNLSSYACSICGRTYLNEGNYRKHLESHPEALSSPTSGLSSSLSTTRFWPCTVCSSVFTTELGLLTHMEQMRTDSKHQFEAQILLSCAAAERRHREAVSASMTQSGANSIGNSSSGSLMAISDMNRNSSSFMERFSLSHLTNNPFKY